MKAGILAQIVFLTLACCFDSERADEGPNNNRPDAGRDASAAPDAGGFKCGRDEDCAAGNRCLRGECVESGRCVEHADCAAGEICVMGECGPQPECVLSSECKEGEKCVAGKCAVAAECDDASDCPAGEGCAGGVCVPAENRPPVAIIEAPAAVNTGEEVLMDGAGSFDPEGGPLSYAWEMISAPAGAETEIADPSSPAASFAAALPGEYAVRLRVFDQAGLSAEAVATVTAQSSTDLKIELAWDNPRSDLDLHLKKEADAYFSETGDCHFANCRSDSPVTLKWCEGEGMEGRPLLEIDDVEGYGPEVISFSTMCPGVYELAVHYWSAHGSPNVQSAAVLRIYVRGRLAAEFSASLDAECALWRAFAIDWPSETITEIGEITEWRSQCGGGGF